MTNPDFNPGTGPDMEALKEWAEQVNDIAAKLVAEDPSIHPITAHVVAQDILSADKATAMVNAGEPAEKAARFVGSYARWGWIVTMVEAGKLSREWFAQNIADEWVSADPDDTDPKNLMLWKQANLKHGGLIRDGRPLPSAKPLDKGMLRVYRGGNPFSVRRGISWTTDPKIAGKFARTMGGRQPVPGGVVITGLVRRSDVLAYLVDRGESEVIVDPKLVTDIHPTGDGS
jgi:hypothetical protein